MMGHQDCLALMDHQDQEARMVKGAGKVVRDHKDHQGKQETEDHLAQLVGEQ